MSTISEKAFQAHVRAILDTYRWHHWHFHDSRRQVRPGVFVGDPVAGKTIPWSHYASYQDGARGVYIGESINGPTGWTQL